MRIGYARVSTDDQTLGLQRDALKRTKCRQIYEEHTSVKTTIRPEVEACLRSLRKGDTLVVWRLDTDSVAVSVISSISQPSFDLATSISNR
jgi:DNA invertase Pin-like site-specific DNA recombinase